MSSGIVLETSDVQDGAGTSFFQVWVGSNDVGRFAYLVVACADPVAFYEVDQIYDANSTGIVWTPRSQVQMMYEPPSSLDSDDPTDPLFLNVQTYSAPLLDAYPGFTDFYVYWTGTPALCVGLTQAFSGTSGHDAGSWPVTAKDETGELTPVSIPGNNLVNPTGGRMISVAAVMDQTPTPGAGWTAANAHFLNIKVEVATRDFDSDVAGTGIDIETGTTLLNWVLIGDAIAAGVIVVPDTGPPPLPVQTVVSIF